MKKILAILAIVLIFSTTVVVASSNSVIVLTNDIDYNSSFEFFAYLLNHGHNVTRANIANFDALKTEPLVVILGGPDAPQGIGDIVDNLLEEEDKEFLRSFPGSKAMYIKNNVWKTPQTVIILAGNNRQDTYDISMEMAGNVANQTMEASEEPEETENKTEILLTIEDEKHGWASDNGYIKNIIFTMNNKGATTIAAVLDLYIYEAPGTIQVYSSSDVAPYWNDSFTPNMNRYANISTKITLTSKGDYTLKLVVRDGTSPEILAFDTKSFSIG